MMVLKGLLRDEGVLPALKLTVLTPAGSVLNTWMAYPALQLGLNWKWGTPAGHSKVDVRNHGSQQKHVVEWYAGMQWSNTIKQTCWQSVAWP